MTLLQYEVFMTVVELKSFTKASDKLGYTQSAVSQMIKSLEDELQVKLLERSRNGVTPTIIGERMLRNMREIMKLKKTMIQEAASFNGLSIGSIKIGITPSVSSNILPKIVGTFRKNYPDIELIIFESTLTDVQKLIKNEEIDVGLTILDQQDGLDQVPILSDQLMVLLQETHSLSSKEYVSLEDISESCFIMPKGDCDILLKKAFNKTKVTPTIRYEIQDSSTIIAMVKEGIALTILPELAIPKDTAGLVSIPLYPFKKRKVGFIIKDIQSISPGLAEFIVHVKHTFNNP
ncbi:DNA-binding transcriptional LysR family regulator [Bacillus mesophilus]|uniref:LysR family transcriptional regulator n=1 Tax=Bacillus mesophilus TaxID=1808955 RepID=A0A6M0Q426_9BACI|nr:LysR family transcriptional regulator [Bacillus mesophilus]MBM7661336.1 DNA-binding transcriptional LysR family regulator [Bacillus mesophilus]NEY71145.1 LysR family transcriptional regulator [Bacillus mesophilus]